jgi:hypothetical protein
VLLVGVMCIGANGAVKLNFPGLAGMRKLCHSNGMKKSRKPKAKKRKRNFIRVEIVPLAEVLPLLKDTPNHKRKIKPDVNQIAAKLQNTSVQG